jgi:hypothetical protein
MLLSSTWMPSAQKSGGSPMSMIIEAEFEPVEKLL